LASNNLNEAGRQRSGEAYFNVNRDRFEYFGYVEFEAVTDNEMRIPVRPRGSSSAARNQIAKNLRSVPSRTFGSWLLTF
jgi:hypothetical protein